MFTHMCLTILITGTKIAHVMPLLTFKICPFSEAEAKSHVLLVSSSLFAHGD